MLKNRGATLAATVLILLPAVGSAYSYYRPNQYAQTANNSSRRQKSDNESPQDITTDVVAYYTKMLALFTGGLVAVGGSQALLFLWQLKIMRESLVDAKKAADTASETAKAANASVEVARDEFFSTHRPHLTIRDIVIEGGNFVFLLINKGESEAIIVESWIFTEYIIDKKRIRPLLSSGHDDLGRLSLGIGEIKSVSWPLGEIDFNIRYPRAGKAVKNRDLTSFPLGEAHLAITIVYTDSQGHKRRSVFRRRWNVENERFERLDDPDQEYSD